MVIESIRSILGIEHKKNLPKRRAYMMFIGNYGGHMAFATDPPYCVAYAMDYKSNDPSKMTPREPLNHAYAMITSNMVVRRLLSLPNWEPADRKHTKGGCLLIPERRAVWPRVVSRDSHTAQPRGSACRFHQRTRRYHFEPLGPSEPLTLFSPAFQGIWNCLLLRKWPS